MVKSLKRKWELGLKRNKLSGDHENISNVAGLSWVNLKVTATKATETTPERFVTYQWSINISRPVSTLDGKHKIQSFPEWLIESGVTLGEEELKNKVEDIFDQIFLAYLELPEPKKK